MDEEEVWLKATQRKIGREVDTYVFDYDGVVVDSVKKSKLIIISSAKKYHCELSFADLAKFDGLIWSKMFPALGKTMGWPAKKTELIAGESLRRTANAVFPVQKGLVKKLKKIKALEGKSILLTNRTMSSVENSARLAGIDLSLFDFVAAADNLKHQKPSPGVWDELWENKHLNFIENVVFVGDNLSDLQTTKHPRQFSIVFLGVKSKRAFLKAKVPEHCLFKDAVSALDFILCCKKKYQQV